jgi:hypothetical protein
MNWITLSRYYAVTLPLPDLTQPPMSHYMVEFDLPVDMPEAYVAKIPLQRLKVNELMQEGRIISYAVSMERGRLWCVVKADSELEVIETIAEFPLIGYMPSPDISELLFHNLVAARIPLFSLN